MLTYVYIGSVGPFENVYVNKKQKSWIFHFFQKGPENSWNISEIVPKFYKSICSIDLTKDTYTNLSNFATKI